MKPQAFARILVAVDDSRTALAAVHAAVALAEVTGGRIRFVHVMGDGDVVRALARMGRDGRLPAEQIRASDSLLRHVSAEAQRAGVDAETASVTGEPAGQLLAAAREWEADLVVMGRSDVRGAGRAYVGAVTRVVLEFSEIPVLVVPRPD